MQSGLLQQYILENTLSKPGILYKKWSETVGVDEIFPPSALCAGIVIAHTVNGSTQRIFDIHIGHLDLLRTMHRALRRFPLLRRR